MFLVQLVLMICTLNVATDRYEDCHLRLHDPTDITTCYNQMRVPVELEPGQIVFTRYCHNMNTPLPDVNIFPPVPKDI